MPQMFRYGALKKALELTQGNVGIIDEASALEFQGFSPKIVEGRSDNIKITRPEDLALAQFYLAQQNLLRQIVTRRFVTFSMIYFLVKIRALFTKLL
jgi:hypothetical protein